MNWYLKVLKNYVNFSGRARRKEFWFFFLFNTLIFFILGFVELFLFGSGDFNPSSPPALIITNIYSLGVLIPTLAVSVRRLHDTGKSGWWLLISLVPVAGFLVLLVFYFIEGDSGTNKYGPDPKMDTAMV